MRSRVPTVVFLLIAWLFIQTISAFAGDEEVVQDTKADASTHEMTKRQEGHHGLQRNLGFSNFLEGWTTPWAAYEENENQAPRVPLLRITPAFFKREVRFNYLYIDDEHKGEADVNEWGIALELPLTLRIKIDIEPKVLQVDTAEHGEKAGFGDTKFALRTMLLESETLSLSTGSVINVSTGDEDRELGEGITTVGQQLAYWMDLGHRMSVHSSLGVDVPTGGNHREDADLDFLYGVALSKTITIKENHCLQGITPFIELNGHKGFGLDKREGETVFEGEEEAESEAEEEEEGEGEQYLVDILPGVRFDLAHELYVLVGFEIPLNGTNEFDKRVWFSIIKDF